MIKFPRDFLWGAATSAYQVEGDNDRCDWWQWEKAAGKEQSGAACRHYQLYQEDFDLAKSLHHNAHRFSIEWSRIEPQEGKFSEEALQHYREVILALRARNIEPLVTLHHFTNPDWFARAGGWEKKESVACFLRYCNFVVNALAKHVRYWITINEPTIYIAHSYILGTWPPQESSFLKARAVRNAFVAAHVRSYELVHSIYAQRELPAPSVGIAQHMQAFVPCNRAFKNRFAAYLRNIWFNLWFLDRIKRSHAMDFIGLNYYSRQLVDVRSWLPDGLLRDTCCHHHHPVKKNSLGWDIYPQGLYEVLMRIKRYKLPVIITENGICTPEDALRWEYISGHIRQLHRAMEDGVAVRGYLYWSLIDNFEWDKGFGPRFGLIDIDYATQKRTVRESAEKFSHLCQWGVLKS